MAMHIEYQTTPFGSYTALDLTATPIYDCKLTIGYSHPSTLAFKVAAPQHSLPLGIRNFIRFWDDAGTNPATGTAFSSSAPCFEGFIEEVNPGQESNEVEIVCYDPTRQVSQAFNTMSVAWAAGTVPSAFPTIGSGASPRVSFNVTMDNDEEYAYCRAYFQTVQQIIQTVLTDQYQPMYWYNAAPGDGTSAGNGVAYVSGDLSSMTYQSQEKEVFESEPIRSVVERMLRYYPRYKLLWRPGDRQWRFQDISASSAVTLTLNDFSGSNPVMSLNIQRSLEGRYTSVKVYGPKSLTPLSPTYLTSGLNIIASGVNLQNTGTSCCNVVGINQLQIADSTKRNVSRILKDWTLINIGDWTVAEVKTPQLLAYWPASEAGPAGWRAIKGWRIDVNTGIISTGSTYIYRYNKNAAPGHPNYENPTDFKFIYCVPDSPLSVRSPSAGGYSGTAYTVANLQNERAIYDEMLAVGYEFNNPVSSASRTAQYQILADRLQEWLGDIIYTGGATLEGLDYQWINLNRKVNLAGHDANGGSLTTGWESIGAYVTDVEYDFEEKLTTLTFSSNQLEMIGEDPEMTKRKLNIKALEARNWVNYYFNTSFRNRTISDPMPLLGDMGMKVQVTDMKIEYGTNYVDPWNGAVQGMPTGAGL